MSVNELKGLAGLDFDVNLDVGDGAQFLTALNLQPVEIGALGIDAETSKQGEDFNAAIEFEAGSSQLLAALDAKFPDGASVVRGNVTSERLDLNDLKNLTAVLDQLKSLVGETQKNLKPKFSLWFCRRRQTSSPWCCQRKKGSLPIFWMCNACCEKLTSRYRSNSKRL